MSLLSTLILKMIILKFPNTTAWSSITAFSIRWLSSLAIAILGFNGPALGQTAEIVGRPTVKNDEITLRVKVTEDGERPAMLLEKQNFKAIVDEEEVDIISWKNPEESVPPPAWIVVLLDFSGSMNRDDSSGTKRFEGAIEAIRRFLEITSARGGDTKVAILPFSKDPYQGCDVYEVKQEDIKSKFFVFFCGSCVLLAPIFCFLFQSESFSKNIRKIQIEFSRYLKISEDISEIS